MRPKWNHRDAPPHSPMYEVSPFRFRTVSPLGHLQRLALFRLATRPSPAPVPIRRSCNRSGTCARRTRPACVRRSRLRSIASSGGHSHAGRPHRLSHSVTEDLRDRILRIGRPLKSKSRGKICPAIADPPIQGKIYPSWWNTFRGLLHSGDFGPERTLITCLDAAEAARKPDVQIDGTHLARHGSRENARPSI